MVFVRSVLWAGDVAVNSTDSISVLISQRRQILRKLAAGEGPGNVVY